MRSKQKIKSIQDHHAISVDDNTKILEFKIVIKYF